jgi:hypothetical protein
MEGEISILFDIFALEMWNVPTIHREAPRIGAAEASGESGPFRVLRRQTGCG